jgi:hypothetical protein
MRQACAWLRSRYHLDGPPRGERHGRGHAAEPGAFREAERSGRLTVSVLTSIHRLVSDAVTAGFAR